MGLEGARGGRFTVGCAWHVFWLEEGGRSSGWSSDCSDSMDAKAHLRGFGGASKLTSRVFFGERVTRVWVPCASLPGMSWMWHPTNTTTYELKQPNIVCTNLSQRNTISQLIRWPVDTELRQQCHSSDIGMHRVMLLSELCILWDCITAKPSATSLLNKLMNDLWQMQVSQSRTKLAAPCQIVAHIWLEPEHSAGWWHREGLWEIYTLLSTIWWCNYKNIYPYIYIYIYIYIYKRSSMFVRCLLPLRLPPLHEGWGGGTLIRMHMFPLFLSLYIYIYIYLHICKYIHIWFLLLICHPSASYSDLRACVSAC